MSIVCFFSYFLLRHWLKSARLGSVCYLPYNNSIEEMEKSQKVSHGTGNLQYRALIFFELSIKDQLTVTWLNLNYVSCTFQVFMIFSATARHMV